MSRVTELEKALTTLFRKGTEVGYTETEIDEFLENIDYHALLQAVWNKAETVYAYRADGKNALSLDYRSAELFKQRATLLYEDVGDSYIGAVFAARSMELWLLEDMGFAVVAKAIGRIARFLWIWRTWWLSLPPCAIPTTNTSSPSMSCDVGKE